MQVLWGDLDRAQDTQRKFYELWRAFGLLPERFMLNTGAIQDSHVGYPLRPEFIESLFYLHRATNSSEWLEIGRDVLSGLETSTWVPCGHAAVLDVRSHAKSDHMNSYFLAETVKYLYLLFDEPGSPPSPGSTAGHGLDINPKLPDDAVPHPRTRRVPARAAGEGQCVCVCVPLGFRGDFPATPWVAGGVQRRREGAPAGLYAVSGSLTVRRSDAPPRGPSAAKPRHRPPRRARGLPP